MAQSFEKASKELEEIIDKLSSGSLSLDDGKNLFENGLELCKFCYKELDGAKGKVTTVKEELGKLIEEEN